MFIRLRTAVRDSEFQTNLNLTSSVRPRERERASRESHAVVPRRRDVPVGAAGLRLAQRAVLRVFGA